MQFNTPETEVNGLALEFFKRRVIMLPMVKRRSFGATLSDLCDEQGLSALALSRKAGMGVNTIRQLQRGLRCPTPETINRIINALRLRDEWVGRLWRAAGIKPVDQPALGLSVWRHLPAALLDDVVHPEIVLFDLVADELLVDLVRSLASLLAWIGLVARSPTRAEAVALRTATQRTFDQSSQLLKREPFLAASDAASALPRAWRHELFAHRESTSTLVGVLKEWAYFPRGFRRVAALLAELKRNRHNLVYSFNSATVEQVVNVHDAMIAHRLWAELDLATNFGAAGQSAQEWDLTNQLSASAGDLYVLLNTPADQIKWSTNLDFDRDRRRDEFHAAAERVDLALRLYELPDLAARVITDPRAPIVGGRPLAKADIEAALRRAVDLTWGLSVRFPGPSPQPTPASSKV